MAFEVSDVGRCNMHRFHLESRFPMLVFHFLKDYALYPDKVLVKVLRFELKGKPVSKQTLVMEEIVDPETFPDAVFITKCILIA